MPNRNCTIHGPYNESYAICPACAGVRPGGEDITLNTASTAIPDDERTLAPTRRQRASANDGTQTIAPQGGRGSLTGTIVEGPQETGLLGWLIVKEAPTMRRGQVLALKQNVIYGRGSKADHQVPDDKMSEIHCRIQRDETNWKVTDTGSTNGTYVNGTKIKETTTLQENDEIKMGTSVFVLKVLN